MESERNKSIIAQYYADYAQGTFSTGTNYSSDIGNALESALSFVIKFTVGSLIDGAGSVIFIGVEVGSLISTGSPVPGASVLAGVLWLAGPGNTLLAPAADGIASVGSRQRALSDEEYKWANDQVFQGTLPPRNKLVLTDTVGPQRRAFTFPRFDGKITLNMGPDAFADPRQYHVATRERKYGEVYIHELVHAWQVEHTPMQLALLADALTSQIKGSNAYIYGNAGPPFKDFNLEQEASIVQDWWAGKTHPYGNQTGIKQDPNSPYSGYIIFNIKTGQF